MAKNNGILSNPLIYVVGVGLAAFIYRDKVAHILDNIKRQNIAPNQNLSLRMKILGVHPENDGTINMDLQVSNSNSFPMAIKSIVGDILINNRAIAGVKFYGDTVVPGNQESIVPLMTRINTPALMQQMGQLFRKGGGALQLVAEININDHPIPLKMTHTL
jgi:LEA14-like dessication related protein